MGGILKGSVDHVFSTNNQQLSRDMFAAMVRFFDSNPQMTRIASNGGGSTATGTVALRLPGYTGDADQSGENAFGVWRWDKPNGSKIYILLQWGYHSNIGPSPGNPAVASPAGGVALQFAMRTDGGNPWNGGSANVGADTKNGTNVWVDGGSTLLVWPRGNGPGGTGATICQYMAGTNYSGSVGTRMQVMMDDDAFWWAADLGGNGGYDMTMYFGPYIPHVGITLSSPNAALVMLHRTDGDAADFNFGNAIGARTGNTSFEGGAVVQPADGVRTVKISPGIGWTNSATLQPNSYSNTYDILDVYLRMEDSTSPSKFGLFGKVDPALLAIVSYMSSHDTNVGRTRAVFGSVTLAHHKLLFPWKSTLTPGSAGTNVGTQF